MEVIFVGMEPPGYSSEEWSSLKNKLKNQRGVMMTGTEGLATSKRSRGIFLGRWGSWRGTCMEGGKVSLLEGMREAKRDS